MLFRSRCSDGGNNLTDQSVEIGVSWSLYIQITPADVIDGFIVHHEGTVGVLQGGVGGQDGVVRLHHRSRCLGSRVDCKVKLHLLGKLNGKSLLKECCKARASSSSKGMEDEESFETSAGLRQLSDSVQNHVNNFLSDGIMPADKDCMSKSRISFRSD